MPTPNHTLTKPNGDIKRLSKVRVWHSQLRTNSYLQWRPFSSEIQSSNLSGYWPNVLTNRLPATTDIAFWNEQWLIPNLKYLILHSWHIIRLGTAFMGYFGPLTGLCSDSNRTINIPCIVSFLTGHHCGKKILLEQRHEIEMWFIYCVYCMGGQFNRLPLDDVW